MDIPAAFFALYNSTVSDLITKNVGVPCKISYANSRTQCINCYINPILGNSSNQYKSGGPVSFTDGTICPYCNGEGYIITERFDTIRMRAYFNRKDFIKIDIPINANNSTIQTIGFITDMPKLQQCVEIIVNTGIGNYSQYRYNLAGEILPWGLGQDKQFCVAFWNRNQ